MPQAKDHIVKSFDEEIRKLNNYITHMGGLAESQLQAAIECLVKRDADKASRIIQDDSKIDEQEARATLDMLARMGEAYEQEVRELKASAEP